MEYTFKLEKARSGWSIVYMEGLYVVIPNKYSVFVSLKINIVLANSADPDELSHYILSASSLFAKVTVLGLEVFKVLSQ